MMSTGSRCVAAVMPRKYMQKTKMVWDDTSRRLEVGIVEISYRRIQFRQSDLGKTPFCRNCILFVYGKTSCPKAEPSAGALQRGLILRAV